MGGRGNLTALSRVSQISECLNLSAGMVSICLSGQCNLVFDNLENVFLMFTLVMTHDYNDI